MAQSLPNARDFLEFADRTKVIDTNVTLGSLLREVSALEQAVAQRDPGIAAGWFVYSPGYSIIVGYGPGEAIREVGKPEIGG
jgi:hypothetical protein